MARYENASSLDWSALVKIANHNKEYDSEINKQSDDVQGMAHPES
jgi:hypothetical protein